MDFSDNESVASSVMEEINGLGDNNNGNISGVGSYAASEADSERSVVSIRDEREDRKEKAKLL